VQSCRLFPLCRYPLDLFIVFFLFSSCRYFVMARSRHQWMAASAFSFSPLTLRSLFHFAFYAPFFDNLNRIDSSRKRPVLHLSVSKNDAPSPSVPSFTPVSPPLLSTLPPATANYRAFPGSILFPPTSNHFCRFTGLSPCPNYPSFFV